jgi:serine acetyltransferase
MSSVLLHCLHAVFQGYQSLQSYRISNVLWNQGRKVLALALQSRISEVKPDFLNSRQIVIVGITSLFE